MIRIIILFVVGYIAYRALKSWIFPNDSSSKSVPGRSSGEIDDIMIKDPYCEAYFPKRNAVHLRFGGKDLYFCSTQCKDKYVGAHSEIEDK
jgi:YHS domain-containing protein